MNVSTLTRDMSNNSAPTNPDATLEHLVEKNRAEVGHYFKNLLDAGLNTWRERRVISLLCRLHAYPTNDARKLLEFANDLRTVHAAQIEFAEKYMTELFLPGVDEREREETNFLDKTIIPFLFRLADKGRQQSI
jgi:hypothetical protein